MTGVDVADEAGTEAGVDGPVCRYAVRRPSLGKHRRRGGENACGSQPRPRIQERRSRRRCTDTARSVGAAAGSRTTDAGPAGAIESSVVSDRSLPGRQRYAALYRETFLGSLDDAAAKGSVGLLRPDRVTGERTGGNIVPMTEGWARIWSFLARHGLITVRRARGARPPRGARRAHASAVRQAYP